MAVCIDTAGVAIREQLRAENPLNGNFFAIVDKKKNALVITYIPQGDIKQDFKLIGSVNGNVFTLERSAKNNEKNLSEGQFQALILSKQGNAMPRMQENVSLSIPLKAFNGEGRSEHDFMLEMPINGGGKLQIPNALRIVNENGNYSVKKLDNLVASKFEAPCGIKNTD